jgi:hypothetical protein
MRHCAQSALQHHTVATGTFFQENKTQLRCTLICVESSPSATHLRQCCVCLLQAVLQLCLRVLLLLQLPYAGLQVSTTTAQGLLQAKGTQGSVVSAQHSTTQQPC